AQKQKGRCARRRRKFRLKIGKDVQLRIQRFGDVEIKAVFAFPEKRLLAGNALKIRHVNLALAEDRFFCRAKVVADDRNHAHVREKRSGDAEVRRRPAEYLLSLSEWRFER